jgi:hypothetical protein
MRCVVVPILHSSSTASTASTAFSPPPQSPQPPQPPSPFPHPHTHHPPRAPPRPLHISTATSCNIPSIHPPFLPCGNAVLSLHTDLCPSHPCATPTTTCACTTDHSQPCGRRCSLAARVPAVNQTSRGPTSDRGPLVPRTHLPRLHLGAQLSRPGPGWPQRRSDLCAWHSLQRRAAAHCEARP